MATFRGTMELHNAPKDPNPHFGELLTITEACAYLKIKRRTIDDWRAAKALPCIERGRWIRFRRSDLEAFIAAHTIQPRNVAACRRRLKSNQSTAA